VTTLASPSTYTNLAGANYDTLSTPHSRPEQRAAGSACAGDGRAILQHRVRRPLGDASSVGQRTTGTQAGDYLISGPGWKGNIPTGMRQITIPDNQVLVIGRVLVYNESDLATAYTLSKQIQLTTLA
jgi:hypothetical protein